MVEDGQGRSAEQIRLIVAVDPGTQGAGFACLIDGAIILSRQIVAGGHLSVLNNWLRASWAQCCTTKVLLDCPPEQRLLVVERQFQNQRCIAAQGVCEALASDMLCGVELVSPQTWQKELLGEGRPKGKALKIAYRNAAAAIVGAPVGPDEAAAICLAVYGWRTRGGGAFRAE